MVCAMCISVYRVWYVQVGEWVDGGVDGWLDRQGYEICECEGVSGLLLV